jgi:hypothetical protein
VHLRATCKSLHTAKRATTGACLHKTRHATRTHCATPDVAPPSTPAPRRACHMCGLDHDLRFFAREREFAPRSDKTCRWEEGVEAAMEAFLRLFADGRLFVSLNPNELVAWLRTLPNLDPAVLRSLAERWSDNSEYTAIAHSTKSAREEEKKVTLLTRSCSCERQNLC